MREKPCRTWSTGRKLKIIENVKHTVVREIWQG